MSTLSAVLLEPRLLAEVRYDRRRTVRMKRLIAVAFLGAAVGMMPGLLHATGTLTPGDIPQPDEITFLLNGGDAGATVAETAGLVTGVFSTGTPWSGQARTEDFLAEGFINSFNQGTSSDAPAAVGANGELLTLAAVTETTPTGGSLAPQPSPGISGPALTVLALALIGGSILAVVRLGLPRRRKRR